MQHTTTGCIWGHTGEKCKPVLISNYKQASIVSCTICFLGFYQSSVSMPSITRAERAAGERDQGASPWDPLCSPWRSSMAWCLDRLDGLSSGKTHEERYYVWAFSVTGNGPTAQCTGVEIGNLITTLSRGPTENVLLCYQQLTPPKNFLCPQAWSLW